MNVEELESIVRDELRRDAANTPSGGAVRAAVLEAVNGLSPVDRPARRWVVPLLVAAAVVALAVAATLLPRSFGRHSQPAHPKPSPSPSVSIPVAPSPVGVTCSKTQWLVDGASTRFTDADGHVGYAYDYYCAASDGSRTGSVIEWFRMVSGRLAYQGPLSFAGAKLYVMSMKGLDGGLLVREYDANPGMAGHPGGVVEDFTTQIDAAGSHGAGEVVAQPCLGPT